MASASTLLRKVDTYLARVQTHLVPLLDALFIAVDSVYVVGKLDPENAAAFKNHAISLAELHLGDWLSEREMAAVKNLFDKDEGQAQRKLRKLSKRIPRTAASNLNTSLSHAIKSIVDPARYGDVIAELKRIWRKRGLISEGK